MFSIHCPRHGTQVLLDSSNIRRITHDADGMSVDWSCTCGQTGRFHTGRRQDALI